MAQSSPHRQLKLLSTLIAVFTIIFALGAFLAFISGVLLLSQSNNSFFTDVDAETAQGMQALYSPFTLFVRLASGLAYSAIIVYCFKNRSTLAKGHGKPLPLPHLIGLVITPVMLVFNVFTNGRELPVTAFIFPIMFTALHAYSLHLVKTLQKES